MASALEVALRHRAGPVSLDVAFRLDSRWTALFAPSGAGKTTILRIVAGLERPDWGRIVLDPHLASEMVLLDTARTIEVAAHRRGVRLVAQRPALFPHLSVAENVAYGTRSRGAQTADVEALCRIGQLMNKMPAQLSGGERQRVALARAVAAAGCRLLLLDEPFTGLEVDLRDELIRDLRAWLAQRGTPVLLVTHDLGEVFAAQAQVLRMEGGRIIAEGSAAVVLGGERDRLLARLRPG